MQAVVFKVLQPKLDAVYSRVHSRIPEPLQRISVKIRKLPSLNHSVCNNDRGGFPRLTPVPVDFGLSLAESWHASIISLDFLFVPWDIFFNVQFTQRRRCHCFLPLILILSVCSKNFHVQIYIIYGLVTRQALLLWMFGTPLLWRDT